MELTVSRVYGQALYDAAVELEKVDEIEKEIDEEDEQHYILLIESQDDGNQ